MRFIYGMMGFKMDQANGGQGGGSGGGGGQGGGQGGQGGQGGGGGESPEMKAMRERAEAAERRAAELEKKNNPAGGGGNNNSDPDLREKAEKERRENEEKQRDVKAVESAVKFNMGLKEFSEKNKDLLPKEVADILRLSDRESYGSEVARANALKAAIMQSYFLVEANLADLTASQKESVAEFLKLSKTGRESKAAELYNAVFEPALEMHKKLHKAQEIVRAKNGYAGSGSSAMDTYKQKLLEAAKRGIINRKKGA